MEVPLSELLGSFAIGDVASVMLSRISLANRLFRGASVQRRGARVTMPSLMLATASYGRPSAPRLPHRRCAPSRRSGGRTPARQEARWQSGPSAAGSVADRSTPHDERRREQRRRPSWAQSPAAARTMAPAWPPRSAARALPPSPRRSPGRRRPRRPGAGGDPRQRRRSRRIGEGVTCSNASQSGSRARTAAAMSEGVSPDEGARHREHLRAPWRARSRAPSACRPAAA
jgi:hypothetical protein